MLSCMFAGMAKSKPVDRLVKELTDRRITQKELAVELGIDDAAVSNWIRRGVIPPGRKSAIAAYFGKARTWLEGDDETEDVSEDATRALLLSAFSIAPDAPRKIEARLAQMIPNITDQLTTDKHALLVAALAGCCGENFTPQQVSILIALAR